MSDQVHIKIPASKKWILDELRTSRKTNGDPHTYTAIAIDSITMLHKKEIKK